MPQRPLWWGRWGSGTLVDQTASYLYTESPRLYNARLPVREEQVQEVFWYSGMWRVRRRERGGDRGGDRGDGGHDNGAPFSLNRSNPGGEHDADLAVWGCRSSGLWRSYRLPNGTKLWWDALRKRAEWWITAIAGKQGHKDSIIDGSCFPGQSFSQDPAKPMRRYCMHEKSFDQWHMFLWFSRIHCIIPSWYDRYKPSNTNNLQSFLRIINSSFRYLSRSFGNGEGKWGRG